MREDHLFIPIAPKNPLTTPNPAPPPLVWFPMVACCSQIQPTGVFFFSREPITTITVSGTMDPDPHAFYRNAMQHLVTPQNLAIISKSEELTTLMENLVNAWETHKASLPPTNPLAQSASVCTILLSPRLLTLLRKPLLAQSQQASWQSGLMLAKFMMKCTNQQENSDHLINMSWKSLKKLNLKSLIVLIPSPKSVCR